MKAINTAIRWIKREIAPEVLDIRYMDLPRKAGINVTSLDRQIEAVTIIPQILPDCNLVGGSELTIDLAQCSMSLIAYNPTANYLVINVPYEVTGYREIMSALSLNFLAFYSTNSVSTYQTNPALRMAEAAMDGVDSNYGVISSSRLEIIGPNTILVHENLVTGISGYLRVKVEHREGLEDINPRYHVNFAELCVLGVKADIYTNLKVRLNEGYVYGGHELNSITDIVNSFEGAIEEYKEYLKTTWRKVAFMNNDESYDRYIRALLGRQS